MKAAIIGSRHIRKTSALAELLEPYRDCITEVISGGASGVDKLAASWAKAHGKKLVEIKPNYRRYGGKLAPIVRNKEIIKRADEVFILWDGQSKGTANAKREAERQGKRIHERQLSNPDQLTLL